MIFELGFMVALIGVGFAIGALCGVVLSFWISEWISRRQKPDLLTRNQPPVEPIQPRKQIKSL